MPAVPISRRLVRWAVMGFLAAAVIAMTAPLWRRPPAANTIPLLRYLAALAQQAGPQLAGWVAIGAAGVLALGGLVWSRSWLQWRRSRVRGAIARRLKPLRPDQIRVRVRWSPILRWLPDRIRVRYPSGMVQADPTEELVEMFAVEFGLTVRAHWEPRRDGITIERIAPPRPTGPDPTRLEDDNAAVGKLHATLAPLLPGLTVDQDETRLDDSGAPQLLVLRYDQTTKDIAPRFRARVQSVIESKVPSPTGAWAIRWRPEQHTVVVSPSEPLPEFALNEGLPAGHTDMLALPLGFGSGNRLRLWRPLKYPHLLISGATGGGKALSLRTAIATPTGWTTMGELRDGDEVFDENGAVCTVVTAHPVIQNRQCFEVSFSDGERIIADADHLWRTETRAARVSRSRAERLEGTRHRFEPVARGHWPALRLLMNRDRVTLADVAAAECRPAPTSLLRRVARTVGSRGVTHRATTWLRGDKQVRRRSQGIPTYPARELITRYIESGGHAKNDQRDRRAGAAIRTTAEIAASLRDGKYINHSIPVAGALQLPNDDLPIPSYVLGCWLGDGTAAAGTITTADPEILDLIRAEGYEVGNGWGNPGSAARTQTIYGLAGQLRRCGLLNDKRVPRPYSRASISQRRDLLAGLLDTDGTVTRSGKIQFDSTVYELADGVLELAVSLGYRATITSKIARLEGRDCGRAWRVSFTTADPVFRLSRKRAMQIERTVRHHPERTGHRYIVDVRPVPSEPVRCITVDSPSRLYLAGRRMVPTHNTALIRTVLVMALLSGWRVWILDPKQTSFQHFAGWPGVERLCITGEEMRQAALDHRDEMQKIYRDLLLGRVTHDQITPILLIFDEVTEGFADIGEFVEENFEDIQGGDKNIKLTRELKRAESAIWRVTRKGREARAWQLLGLQRPDTRFIPGEARDNLISRAAAGQMRGDGLEMMFEDPSVKQRVTKRIEDPETGEIREQQVPGRITVDLGDGPEPMQSLWTPDPAKATDEERALLERLREQVADAQIARMRREKFAEVTREMADEGEPVPPASAADRSSGEVRPPVGEQVPAGDLEAGQWILLEVDGETIAAEVVELTADDDDDSVTVEYCTLDGEAGGYELEAAELVTVTPGPDPELSG